MASIPVHNGCVACVIIIIIIARVVHSFTLVKCIVIITVMAIPVHIPIGRHGHRVLTSLNVKPGIQRGYITAVWTTTSATHSITKFIAIIVAVVDITAWVFIYILLHRLTRGIILSLGHNSYENRIRESQHHA